MPRNNKFWKGPTKIVPLRMAAALYDAVARAARLEGIPTSTLIRRWIEQHVDWPPVAAAPLARLQAATDAIREPESDPEEICPWCRAAAPDCECCPEDFGLGDS